MTPLPTRYVTTVTRVGEQVPEFVEQGILILFAEGAPEELHFFSVLHQPEQTTGGVRPGDVIHIDDHALRVTAVGHVANDNLVNLGHIDLKANGADDAPLPGDVCVEAVPLPKVRPGTRLVIEGVETDAAAGEAAEAASKSGR
ncbi:MAG TPA: PTS glucitol/sorbitol transporter subunit IIA [Actinomycetes bacterium]|jgi:PTS system glucitol/sorbitol-specific IIA component|nr:PTS glucitol/sorbitol transporter subunit IIA [Actinomycetes bacterium]